MILKWVYGRVILSLHRISEAVTRWACHDVAVIWAVTPEVGPKYCCVGGEDRFL